MWLWQDACSRTARLQVGDLAAEALDGELVPLLPRPALAPLMLQQRLEGLDLLQRRAALTAGVQQHSALNCVFESSTRLPARLDTTSSHTVLSVWAGQ